MSEEKYTIVKIPTITLEKDWDEPDYKLGHLISEGVIHINNGWWKTEKGLPWEEDAVSLHVGCNDVFAWGCADSEDIKYSEIDSLYEMYKKDSSWGPAIWCIQKRKLMPQKPVIKIIKDLGIWDLNSMNLVKND